MDNETHPPRTFLSLYKFHQIRGSFFFFFKRIIAQWNNLPSSIFYWIPLSGRQEEPADYPWLAALYKLCSKCSEIFMKCNIFSLRNLYHPRRPRGSQSGRVKRRDESFQAWAEEPLGTDSHRTISKRSSECWLLIGHKKCFVLLCPIGEQHLLSSFCEFVNDGY